MSRVILHLDFNSHYTAVEMLYNPALRALPVAVSGKRELRHGIIVSVNMLAKQYGVKVGNTVGEALQKCPHLTLIPIQQALYDQFPPWAREIYEEYSDYIESYGPDGTWLDITNLVRDEYDGQSVADEIRFRIKESLGITVSVGVSFNKTISKMGSDLRKPDATTVISRAKFKEIVWPLPAEKLLGVGAKINRILYAMGITDIGNIAKAPVELFEDIFGKNGRTLHKYASGEENSPVKHKDYVEPIKSIGHIHTTYRDMNTIEDVKHEIYSLSEKAAWRMRENKSKCRTVQVYIREYDLKSCVRQGKLETPSFITNDIAERALEIFRKQYKFTKPLRSIGVGVDDLVSDSVGIQGSLFDDTEWEIKMEKVAHTMDILRNMYGYDIINRAVVRADRKLTDVPPEYNRTGYRVGSAFFQDA